MLFALLLLTAIPACEQSSVEPEGRLITLNVVATTNKGEPVTDLGPSDVRIKEDGKPRPVAVLRFAGSKASAIQAESAKPPLGPTIVVVDRWNERLVTTGSATWIEIRAGLQAVQPGDPVYLYFLDNHGEMVPIRPLPRPDDTRKAFETSSQEMIARLDEVAKTSAGFRGVEALDPVLRASVTFRALGSLRLQMAGLAGRKNLLWVTHGVPLNAKLEAGGWADFTQQVTGFGAEAARSQVAIYCVDESAAGAAADPAGQARATLKMLTAITGGRWFQSNAFPQALAACLNDARSNYSVAYYSPLQDRKYHKIHLESVRKGVHLLTPDGYDGGSH